MIGFGSFEDKSEKDVQDIIVKKVNELYTQLQTEYFSDELCESLDLFLGDFSKEKEKQYDVFKTAEKFPDRYYSVWFSVAKNASNIVVICNFSHINRRHDISPDGWALMQTERLVHIKTLDMDK